MKSIFVLTDKNIILNNGLLKVLFWMFFSFTNVQLDVSSFQVRYLHLRYKLNQYPEH